MAEVESSTRKCSACGHVKSLENFYNRKGSYGGPCRPCSNAQAKRWQAEHPESKRASDKAYYARHKERLIRKATEARRANPEPARKRQNRYRWKNIERVRANEAAYRSRNKAICNQRIAEWKAKNKHLLAFYARGRQAALRKAQPKWANLNEMRRLYAMASRLRRETGEAWHVDHIVPLISELVCGLHWEGNLQILPATENLRKNNTKWPDMPYAPKRRLAYV